MPARIKPEQAEWEGNIHVKYIVINLTHDDLVSDCQNSGHGLHRQINSPVIAATLIGVWGQVMRDAFSCEEGGLT